MGVTYSYRTARGDDQAAIFQLYCQVMKEYVEEIWGWDQRWQERDFAEHFEPENITVVFSGGQMVAYAQVKPQKDMLFIRMLLLAPEHQKRGVGTKLLSRILRAATVQSLGVQLQVFKINEWAQRFYERQGFRAVSETSTSWVMELNA